MHSILWFYSASGTPFLLHKGVCGNFPLPVQASASHSLLLLVSQPPEIDFLGNLKGSWREGRKYPLYGHRAPSMQHGIQLRILGGGIDLVL